MRSNPNLATWVGRVAAYQLDPQQVVRPLPYLPLEYQTSTPPPSTMMDCPVT